MPSHEISRNPLASNHLRRTPVILSSRGMSVWSGVLIDAAASVSLLCLARNVVIIAPRDEC